MVFFFIFLSPFVYLAVLLMCIAQIIYSTILLRLFTHPILSNGKPVEFGTISLLQSMITALRIETKMEFVFRAEFQLDEDTGLAINTSKICYSLTPSILDLNKEGVMALNSPSTLHRYKFILKKLKLRSPHQLYTKAHVTFSKSSK